MHNSTCGPGVWYGNVVDSALKSSQPGGERALGRSAAMRKPVLGCAQGLEGCQNQRGEQKKNQNSVHPNEHLLIVQVLGKTLHVGFYPTLILSYQVSYPLDST